MKLQSTNDENWPQTLTTLSVVVLILAVCASIVPGLYFIAPAVGFIVLAESRVLQSIRRNQWTMPLVSFAIANLIAVSVFAVAYLAPVKTTDRFLEQTIRVPATRLSLAEIAGSPDAVPPEWYPRSVHFSVPEDAMQNSVEFPAVTITLREFVDAIEGQTEIRHHFSHCGNGSTILWGGDCSMGFNFWRPPNPRNKQAK